MKIIKAIVCVYLLSAIISLYSCEDEHISALNKPISHENISVSLIDAFGDENNSYVIAEVRLSENDSVYDGKIADIIVTGDITGSYSTNCIGYNEEEKTQFYLVHIQSTKKGRVDIDFANYRSTSDPMHTIVDANWKFSINLHNQDTLINTIVVDDNVLDQILIYNRAIILIPAQYNTVAELSACKIEIKDEFESTMDLLANSLSVDNCYLSYGCLLLQISGNQNNMKKIIIDGKEYMLE